MPGTNAVYTFKGAGDRSGDVHIYDNCDAHPRLAAEKLQIAMQTASDETTAYSKSKLRALAEALVIGDVPDSLEALVFTPDWRQSPGTNYRYEIEEDGGNLSVTVLIPDHSKLPEDFRLKPGQNFPEWQQVFHGSIDRLAAFESD